MYLGKLSKLLITATLSVASLGGSTTAFGGELSSEAASELMQARQEYINAYQNLTNKSKQIEQMNKSAPNAILNLTGSVHTLRAELSKQCEADCVAIAESHKQMKGVKFEEKVAALQRKINEISERFFSDAAREARWNQARDEVSHHFPAIEQEVRAAIHQKYIADYERTIAEARSAITEEFQGAFSEYREALIADYDRRFNDLLNDLKIRFDQDIQYIGQDLKNTTNHLYHTCSSSQKECVDRWLAVHNARLAELEDWGKKRWNEIMNSYGQWGAWAPQMRQNDIREMQLAVANAQRQSHQVCKINCDNEIESIVANYYRRVEDANAAARQREEQTRSHYNDIYERLKNEHYQPFQQELDDFRSKLWEELNNGEGPAFAEALRIDEISKQEAWQQINERCELLIRRCFLDKDAEASALCRSLMDVANQDAKLDWEQFEKEADLKCFAQITSIQDSYQKRIEEGEARLYEAAGKIFEEYNQAQIAVNEAKSKFEEKGQKLVDAQAQDSSFMDELDELDESEKTPSLLQALKEAIVKGFKDAIPIWTPTKEASSAMDAIATAAMEGRYEDIDENFNKVSQELVNLMRDTNDARYGFVIKPMIWEQITKQVEKYKEETGTYVRNYKWSNEFISSERILKDRLPNAKTQQQISRVHRDAEIARKYEISHKRQMWWKETGFPDFEPYAKTSNDGRIIKVEIEVSGNRSTDNARAARKSLEIGLITYENFDAFLSPEKIGFVWHHVEDGKTMLLIPKDIHEAFPHTGGVSIKKLGRKQN